MKKIYLDYAATTPLDPEVAKAMEPYSQEVFGNASSVHWFGQQAAKATDEARVMVAKFLNCQPTEVVFTSGATESNNTAIKGTFFYRLINSNTKARNSKQIQNSNDQNSKRLENSNFEHSGIVSDFGFQNSDFSKFHIVTTEIEHPSVLEACRSLQQMGLAELTYVKPQPNGIVAVEDVVSAIKENTALVSVMYANNEIGTIQPIREIGRALAHLKNVKTEKRKNRKTIEEPLKNYRRAIDYPLFHTDATQAAQFLNCRVDKLGVDLLSMSAHKIYGPKGVGALYIKKNTPIARLLDGGSQEFDHRAGTLNTAGVVGFGKAIELAVKDRQLLFNGASIDLQSKNHRRTIEELLGYQQDNKITILRDRLIKGILSKISAASLNGDPIHRLPNNVNIRFNGVDGQTLVMALDQEGIAASSGSACASGAPEPSHVISAIAGEKTAKESVRFTIGKWTSLEDIEKTISSIKKIVQKMRAK